MKIYILFFCLFLNSNISESKLVKFHNNYNTLTTYYFNNSNCNSYPVNIIRTKVYNCTIDNLLTCQIHNNHTKFITCENINITNSYNDLSNLKIFLTTLIFLLIFIFYKAFFENFIDNFFIGMFDKLTEWCYYRKITNYDSIDDYSSL